MFRTLILGMAAAVVCSAQSGGLMVGTYDSDALVVAYYKNSNPHFKKQMDALMAEQAKAKQAGDQEAMAKIEKKGGELQQLASQQLMGKAPIDNILEALRPALPEIARAAHVDLIVSQILYQAPGTDSVDITALLVEQFHPDEKTREMIRNMRVVQP